MLFSFEGASERTRGVRLTTLNSVDYGLDFGCGVLRNSPNGARGGRGPGALLGTPSGSVRRARGQHPPFARPPLCLTAAAAWGGGWLAAAFPRLGVTGCLLGFLDSSLSATVLMEATPRNNEQPKSATVRQHPLSRLVVSRLLSILH